MRNAVAFSQGSPPGDLLYIQHGSVKLSVLSRTGKEAVVAMLGPGDFFGEGCLAGQQRPMVPPRDDASTVLSSRRRDARCCTRSTAWRTGLSPTCWRATSASRKTWSTSCSTPAKSGWRGRCCSWRATARATTSRAAPEVSQETLAEIVGTTRSRVNFFMNKFRKLGFIEYNGGINVNSSLLSVVLHD